MAVEVKWVPLPVHRVLKTTTFFPEDVVEKVGAVSARGLRVSGHELERKGKTWFCRPFPDDIWAAIVGFLGFEHIRILEKCGSYDPQRAIPVFPGMLIQEPQLPKVLKMTAKDVKSAAIGIEQRLHACDINDCHIQRIVQYFFIRFSVSQQELFFQNYSSEPKRLERLLRLLPPQMKCVYLPEHANVEHFICMVKALAPDGSLYIGERSEASRHDVLNLMNYIADYGSKIEAFNFSRCEAIGREDILYVIKKCRRLKYLELHPYLQPGLSASLGLKAWLDGTHYLNYTARLKGARSDLRIRF